MIRPDTCQMSHAHNIVISPVATLAFEQSLLYPKV